MRLISVVMNEPDTDTRNKETTALLDYGFNTYSMDNILTKDSILGKIKISLGNIKEVEVVPKEDVNILNNKTLDKRKVTYDVELFNPKIPIKVGDVVGKLKVIEDNNIIMNIDITVKHDVEKANIGVIFLRNLESIIMG